METSFECSSLEAETTVEVFADRNEGNYENIEEDDPFATGAFNTHDDLSSADMLVPCTTGALNTEEDLPADMMVSLGGDTPQEDNQLGNYSSISVAEDNIDINNTPDQEEADDKTPNSITDFDLPRPMDGVRSTVSYLGGTYYIENRVY